MTEFDHPPRGEDTDLLCVEVSALGQAPMPAALPKVSHSAWQQQQREEAEEERQRDLPMSGADQAHEDFLASMLLKTDAYRPLQTSLLCMEDPEFLDMRGAVVNWFSKVSVSYNFANETVAAALSHFDRYVSLTVAPVNDHMLLQLAAYVALLVASKMGETCPLRMKSLANRTGRMFTPLQVKRLEMDMISKLNFRLAPPSADETLHCLSTLLHNGSSSSRRSSSPASAVPHAEILSAGSYYLKKARARTCWFRHSPYTLAVAALATAYNSMGLGRQRRRLLRECDARARAVTGRGLDIHGVAASADAMANDERAAEAVAAATLRRQARGSTESPVCGGGGGDDEAIKEGWGSPTGVAQGAAELLQKAAFAAVGRGNGGDGVGDGVGDGGAPSVEDLSPPKSFSPCGAVPTKAAASHVVAGRRVVRRVSSSPRATAPRPRVSTSPRDIVAPARQVSASTSPLYVERAAPAPAAVPRRVSSASAPPQQYLELADEASRRQSDGGGQKRRLHQSEGSCFVPCARRRSVEGEAGLRVGVDVDVSRQERSEQARHQVQYAVRVQGISYGYEPSTTNTQQREGPGSGHMSTSQQHQQQQQRLQQSSAFPSTNDHDNGNGGCGQAGYRAGETPLSSGCHEPAIRGWGPTGRGWENVESRDLRTNGPSKANQRAGRREARSRTRRSTALHASENSCAVESDARGLRVNKDAPETQTTTAAAAAVNGHGRSKVAAGAGLMVQLPRPAVGDDLSSTTPGGDDGLGHGNNGFGCSLLSTSDDEWGQQQRQHHPALEDNRPSTSRVIANLRASVVACDAQPSSGGSRNSSFFCAAPVSPDLAGSAATNLKETRRGVTRVGFSPGAEPYGGFEHGGTGQKERRRPQSAEASSVAGRFSLSARGGADGAGRRLGATAPSAGRVITNIGLFEDAAVSGKAVAAARRQCPEGKRGGTARRVDNNQQQNSSRRPKSATVTSSADRRARAMRAPTDYSFFPSAPPAAANIPEKHQPFDGGHPQPLSGELLTKGDVSEWEGPPSLCSNATDEARCMAGYALDSPGTWREAVGY
eukprot:g16560.t1